MQFASNERVPFVVEKGKALAVKVTAAISYPLCGMTAWTIVDP